MKFHIFYTHYLSITVHIVGDRFEEFADQGGSQQDGNEDRGHKLPHDLPVSMWLMANHFLDVLRKPEKNEEKVHETTNFSNNWV